MKIEKKGKIRGLDKKKKLYEVQANIHLKRLPEPNKNLKAVEYTDCTSTEG